MNVWLLAALILVLALFPCLLVCLTTTEGDGLAAVELASVIVSCILLLLAQGLHRQPFVDLALTFALISLVGSIAFARMMEHEL